ncbi:copper chaperone PCu(A)C [Thiohalorhabdus sp. Cl-TMA]|uniref:Copper chaperone PCu(A)C n=1 Tax=Thiohalorhabdus methylotrophus TaxID=3242694 RepID=A0ABV4TYW6_9GAMM
MLVALAAIAPAHAGEIEISEAWIRNIPGGAPSAGYFRLRNGTDGAVRLVAAESPAYGRIGLHRTTDSGMAHVERVNVPAGGQVAFAPGGYHLMLMEQRKPVEIDDRIPIRLRFADGKERTARFIVRPPYAQGPE